MDKAKLLKVKRKAEETPLELLILEEGESPTVYLRVPSPSDQVVQKRPPLSIERGIDVELVPISCLLDNVSRSMIKRPKVECIAVGRSLDDIANMRMQEELEAQTVDDYYIRRDHDYVVPSMDPMLIGTISNADQIIFATSDYTSSDEFDEYEADSNAEDHPDNDYPEEDEDCFDHALDCSDDAWQEGESSDPKSFSYDDDDLDFFTTNLSQSDSD